MIDKIKERERTLKKIKAEYQKEKECLNLEILELTKKLADNIAKNFSTKYGMTCNARLNLDNKLYVIYINYNGDDSENFFDTFCCSKDWLVRIKADFSPKEKFKESEIAEWFNGILADYLTEAESESEWNYDDNNEIQQNSNVRRRK